MKGEDSGQKSNVAPGIADRVAALDAHMRGEDSGPKPTKTPPKTVSGRK
jgi:hypothetical protein